MAWWLGVLLAGFTCLSGLHNHTWSTALQVLMDQLWCYIHTCTRDPVFEGGAHLSDLDTKRVQLLFTKLYAHGVDWTDPSAWPEDCANGKWERQIPIPFLLENSGPRVDGCLGVINAICKGDKHHSDSRGILPILAADDTRACLPLLYLPHAAWQV